jgi:hypothetical protein
MPPPPRISGSSLWPSSNARPAADPAALSAEEAAARLLSYGPNVIGA